MRDAVTVAGQRGTAVLALVVIGGRVFAVVVPPAGRAQLLELGEAAALRLAARRVSRDADAAARGETDPRLGPLIAAAVRDSVAVLDELLRPALRLVGAVPAVVLAGELFGAIAWGCCPAGAACPPPRPRPCSRGRRWPAPERAWRRADRPSRWSCRPAGTGGSTRRPTCWGAPP